MADPGPALLPSGSQRRTERAGWAPRGFAARWLGVFCVIASAGIASLAAGLRMPLWAQLLVAAAAWLILTDAAFFDTFASPFSEPAVLTGLLLVAAGVIYLGREGRAAMFGLALVGLAASWRSRRKSSMRSWPCRCAWACCG